MRAETIHRMCLGKIAYPAEVAEKIVLRRNGGGVRLKGYLCPVCGKQHLAKLDIESIPSPANDVATKLVHAEFIRLLGLYPQYGNKRLRKMAMERIAVEAKYAQWKEKKNKPPAPATSANVDAERR